MSSSVTNNLTFNGEYTYPHSTEQKKYEPNNLVMDCRYAATLRTKRKLLVSLATQNKLASPASQNKLASPASQNKLASPVMPHKFEQLLE